MRLIDIYRKLHNIDREHLPINFSFNLYDKSYKIKYIIPNGKNSYTFIINDNNEIQIDIINNVVAVDVYQDNNVIESYTEIIKGE